mgnify:CR=1 FL=1
MHGIEKGLHIDLAVLAGRVGVNLDESARKLLAVKGFRMKLRAVVEVQFTCDLLHRGVQVVVVLEHAVKDVEGGHHDACQHRHQKDHSHHEDQ